MTSKEFVLWLQGFTQGVHEYNVSPKQWDILKAKLAEVNDEPSYNTHPPYVNGNGHPNPYYFTTTAYGYPSGSARSYTNSTNSKPVQSEEHSEKHHNQD